MAEVDVQDDVVEEQKLVTREQPKLQKPRKYRVLLLNDDYTPMDFVVTILRFFFSMSEEMANLVMWQVHKTGKGECGLFTRDIAETKVALVNSYVGNIAIPYFASWNRNSGS